MDLNVSIQQKAPNGFIVSLEGSLDSYTHPLLQDKIDEFLNEATDTITFDMEKLEYISSAGIRVVLKTRNALEENNGDLLIVNMKPKIEKVFDIINALPLMKVFTSIKELDEYLDNIQKKVID
jgi:anti-sigma B factor antagonist